MIPGGNEFGPPNPNQTPPAIAAAGAVAGGQNPLQAIGSFFGSLGVLGGWLGNPLRIIKLFAGILLVNIALLVTFLPAVGAAIGGIAAGPEGAIAGYGVGRSARRGQTGYTRESLRIYRGSQRRSATRARTPTPAPSAPQRVQESPSSAPPPQPSREAGARLGRYNRQTKRRTPARTEQVARSGKG